MNKQHTHMTRHRIHDTLSQQRGAVHSEPFVSQSSLPEFILQQKTQQKRTLTSFDLELTARCNNNCRHCYINLPAQDKEARAKEISLDGIKKIADEASSLGALWCLLTGGEPLLRDDFFDIYLYLKEKGLLVSVFTNAILITEKHIEFFKKYPPRDIEVTVYGVTQETYERVTRTNGSFGVFKRGLDLLLKNKIKVRLKAMALRSNFHELPEIAYFCRKRTTDYFRFDPFLYLRFDGNRKRNDKIKEERLSLEEIVAIEQQDPERSRALEKNCDKLIDSELSYSGCNHLFHCGAGMSNFVVSHDGFFRLCSSLWHPECVFNLKEGTIVEAWQNFVPRVRDMHSDKKDFLEKCRRCELINLCMWCPGNSYLEMGEMDRPVDYFCKVAHARAETLEKKL